MKPITSCGQCDDGIVCEDHPDQPMNHPVDGAECGGAGQPCDNPECRFSVLRTGLICPRCQRSHGSIELETHRVIRFKCLTCAYEWYAEHSSDV